MLAFALLQWWYTAGWLEFVRRMARLATGTMRAFSLSMLLKTLFAPWKGTVDAGGPNANMQQRLHIWLGNLISRFVGFLIRSLTMLSALILFVLTMLGGAVAALAWPLVPLMIVYSLYRGVAGL